MFKKILIVLVVINVLVGCSLGKNTMFFVNAEIDVHYKPYQIIIINNYYSGMFIEAADINTRNKLLEIEYLPGDFGKVKVLELKVGEITKYYDDIKVLQTIKIENKDFDPDQYILKKEFVLQEFKQGMIIVLWVGDVNPSYKNFVSLTKEQLLERAMAIRWEQDRLTNILSNKGSAALEYEVTRNYEE